VVKNVAFPPLIAVGTPLCVRKRKLALPAAAAVSPFKTQGAK